MTKQVLKLQPFGKCTVTVQYKYDDPLNPYRVYSNWHDQAGWHKKQIAKYADLASCLYLLASRTNN